MSLADLDQNLSSRTCLGCASKTILGQMKPPRSGFHPEALSHRRGTVYGRTTAGPALVLFLIMALASSCAVGPLSRSHPSLPEKLKAFKNIALISPRVDVFYLETGGLPEKRDEWSEQARNNVLAAVQSELKSRTNLAIQPVSRNPANEETPSSLDSTYSLFEVVNQSVLLHTYHPRPEYRFEDKIKNFDYSLGAEVKEIIPGESDSLLLVTGKDHIWSEGRKALQALGVILGIGAGVATGVVVIPQLGGGTDLQAALVDSRSGDLLWYHAVGGGAGHDLRDPQSAAGLVKNLFNEFPASTNR